MFFFFQSDEKSPPKIAEREKEEELKKWTQPEIKQFRELVKKYSKNFTKISSEMETKTVKECVYYFFHSDRKKLKFPREKPEVNEPN